MEFSSRWGRKGFFIREGSKGIIYQKAFLAFSRALASSIVQCAEVELSRLPRPAALPDEWLEVGLDIRGQLFPGLNCDESLRSFLVYGPAWEKKMDKVFSDTREVINYALSDPRGPFTHLPALIYLAQHPRVQLSQYLHTLHEFGALNPPCSPPYQWG